MSTTRTDSGARLPASLHSRLGSLDQLARLEQFESIDGPSKGARRIRLVTGGGLDLEIHIDRGMDIGHASVDGMPVSWISDAGVAAPALVDPHGAGWLRGFGGGLLATCGFRSFGPPSVDQGEAFGMHGRIGATPARLVRVERTDSLLIVEGELRETIPMGDSMRIRRTISSAIGGRSVRIEDVVVNMGASAAAFMVLYHVNLGWPLLDEGTRIEIPAQSAAPRDAAATAGFDTRAVFGPPLPMAAERVYVYRFDGSPRAWVSNPARGLECLVTASDTLPAMFQWTMEQAGTYALGIEPANTPAIQGRARARESGELPVLAPREEVRLWVEISFEGQPSIGG